MLNKPNIKFWKTTFQPPDNDFRLKNVWRYFIDKNSMQTQLSTLAKCQNVLEKILPTVAQGTKTLYNLLNGGNKKPHAAGLNRCGGV